MTNMLARLSKAKYVAKSDAHCTFAEGFDVALMADMQDDWTVVPIMQNLHAFDWKCLKCGSRWYQGPTPTCCLKNKGKPGHGTIPNETCDSTEFVRKLVWQPREGGPHATSYCFDPEPHFQYFGDFAKRPEGRGDLTPSMSLQGSFFMMTRKKYWELNICDEKAFGSWGSQGIEVAVKTWLSGGQVMVSHKTHYAHMFRTQGGSFSFPYPVSDRAVKEGRKTARELFFENKWPLQKYPLSWLVEKFWPVNRWNSEDLARVKEAGAIFLASHPLANPTDSLNPVTPFKKSRVDEGVSAPTGVSSSAEHIIGVSDSSQVSGIAATPIPANVVKLQSLGDSTDQPFVDETMNTNPSAVLSAHPPTGIQEKSPVSGVVELSSPVPASSRGVHINVRDESGDSINSHGNSIPQNMVSKGIIFYTDNTLPTKLAHQVQDRIKASGLPIVSASLKPMDKMGTNLYFPVSRGKLTMFLQILACLEASTSEIVFFCEHDVLYHESYFKFTSPSKDKFYYNTNVWRARQSDGKAVTWEANQVAQLSGYREHLLDYYRKKIDEILESGFNRSYEPGGRDKSQYEQWRSGYPNIDIRHGGNLSSSKWSPDDFRDKSTCVNWQETTLDKIEGWDNLSKLIQ